MTKGMKKRGGRRPRRAMRPRKNLRRSGGVPEWASCTEVTTGKVQILPGQKVALWTTNIMYQMYNISLSQFTRASEIGKNYQYYRIKNVKLTFKPLFDTFAPAGGAVAPHLYYLIDKTGSAFQYTTGEQLKRSGAVSHRLDEKIINVNYRPSVPEATLINNPNVFTPSKFKISPWLVTNTNNTQVGGFSPSGVDHYGIKWVVENAGGAGEFNYMVDIQIEFQFKKAVITATPTGEGLEVVEVFQTDGEENGEFAPPIPPPA